MFFVLLFFTSLSYSQLSDFNLNVVATDETCSGNGALNMSVSNTTSGASIIYTLFLLPDVTNPISETTNDFFLNLQAGNYNVVATQILNGEENTQEQNGIINDLITQLDFEVSHFTTTDCDTVGSITVNVLTGNAVLYEIISGPEIISPQASNVFENLQSGTYIIRVFDNCDNAVSKTYTMILNTNNFSISNVSLPPVYNNCSQIEVSNIISAPLESPIIYPLLVTHTIIPPDGSSNIVFTQNLTSGTTDTFNLTQIIPLFGGESFTMDINITDSCGNIFEISLPINPNPKINLIALDESCGQVLDLTIENFRPPFSMNFTSFPDGFIPTNFNEDYPGPYNESPISFGAEGNPLPNGIYSVDVIDACGRVGTSSITIEEPEIEPLVNISNSGCSPTSGFLLISITDRELVSAVIIAAPSSYSQTLPHDVSSFIDNGELLMEENLPAGNYTILIIDDCGVEYEIETSIPEFQFQELNIVTLPDCETATGSVKLESVHGGLISTIIIDAPLTFTESLPFDVSANINTAGNFFLTDLPIGNYVFQSEDTCDFQYNTEVVISSYSSNSNAYVLSRNCGSFDVGINDLDESVTNQTYWLQLFYEDTNTWGHPNTGFAYVDGQLPDATTAIEIENSETLFNIFLVGDFRLIKVFQSFNSDDPDAYCLDVFANFTIFSDLVITGVYNLDCDGGGGDVTDVIIDAIGVQPYNFTITSPLVIDNGENNTFLDLPPGTYEVRFEDACGGIENTIVNLENLLPLARANMPDNITVCREDFIEADSFLLTNQNAQILGNQDPNNYNVTYHISQIDAENGNNPLPDEYSNISNPQTIYARVTHNNLIVCYATTSFEIYVGQTPELSQEMISFICPDDTVTLTADPGFDAYNWSTGETSQSITVAEPGTYSVLVKNIFQDFTCENIKEFVVTSSEIATIEDITISDWTQTENSITVLVSGIGDYQYSLDNINFQLDNTFTNLLAGEYTIYVKDINGCGTVVETILLLDYPRFFTPNGDTTNEFWQIKFAANEPELKVVVFDRFGKLIAQFGSQDLGWDGTYNGLKMPTSDYWFEVTRANNLKYKGHFTLKR